MRHLKNCDQSYCIVCPLAKQTKLPFQLSSTVSHSAFELVHCDVWGPYRVPTYDSKRFFVIIVDDFTRYTWVFLTVSKSDTIVVLREFVNKVKNVFSSSIKLLRTYNGGAFFIYEFRAFMSDSGIEHQSTCAYTPHQNGVTERRHRTILNMAGSLRFQAADSGESVLTIVYLLNRLPSKVIADKS